MKCVLQVLKSVTLLIVALTVGVAFQVAGAFAADGGGGRGRSIDFEEELIEGVNKKPYDSLNQISERDKRKKKPHLYNKRGSFKTETEESLRETRFVQ